MYATIAKTTTQYQGADDWNVVVRLDRRFAFRAGRVRKYDRLFAWNSVNDNVEETANDGAYHRHKSTGDRQGRVQGAIYRRQVHSGKHCSAAHDPIPTAFLVWSSFLEG